MRVFPLALHLPLLLLRLLQLVLPLPPFAPGPSPWPPRTLPTPSRRDLWARHRPTRRPLPLGADAPLAPAHSAKARPAPLYRAFGPRHAPDSAKKHPAAPSVMPATAGIHPYHPRAPNLAKKRPAATEEFFRKRA